MLKKEIANLLNEQVNKELFSAYLYLDMRNYYINENLNGFANWFYVQAKEEIDHAMLIMTYMQDNDEEVKLLPLNAPDKVFENHLSPLKEALKHEQYVTASINQIYEKASELKEYKTIKFLDWFISEQVEEEKNAQELIKKYELFGKDSQGLYLLDQELGQRVYTAPSISTEE
ncbi:MAG: ferritin [Clostridiaceae bacterium]|nr:ferritin [Clostridiaceae bacterium]